MHYTHAPLEDSMLTAYMLNSLVPLQARGSHKSIAACRQSEINLKKELNMQAEVKRAEIALVQRVLHRSKVANFIQTSAGPPLCWLPGKHNAATQSLLQKEQEKLEDFKVRHIASHQWQSCSFVATVHQPQTQRHAKTDSMPANLCIFPARLTCS